jgi:hypothetical protein
VGADKLETLIATLHDLEALIATLGELESLHPNR